MNMSDYERALSAIESGDYDLAIGLLTDLQECNDKTVNAYLARAHCYYMREEYMRSIADVMGVLRASLHEPRAHRLLGMITHDMGDYETAIKHYSKSIELVPTDIESRYQRAVCHAMMSGPDVALREYSDVIRVAPDHYLARLDRGLAFQAKGLYSQAIDDFSEMIRLWPSNPSAYRIRSKAYQECGQEALAKADESIALELETSSRSDK